MYITLLLLAWGFEVRLLRFLTGCDTSGKFFNLSGASGSYLM